VGYDFLHPKRPTKILKEMPMNFIEFKCIEREELEHLNKHSKHGKVLTHSPAIHSKNAK